MQPFEITDGQRFCLVCCELMREFSGLKYFNAIDEHSKKISLLKAFDYHRQDSHKRPKTYRHLDIDEITTGDLKVAPEYCSKRRLRKEGLLAEYKKRGW